MSAAAGTCLSEFEEGQREEGSDPGQTGPDRPGHREQPNKGHAPRQLNQVKQSGLSASVYVSVLSTVEQAGVFVLLPCRMQLSLNCRLGRPMRTWIVSISPSVEFISSVSILSLSHTCGRTHAHTCTRTQAQMTKGMAPGEGGGEEQVTARCVDVAAEQMNHVMRLDVRRLNKTLGNTACAERL